MANRGLTAEGVAEVEQKYPQVRLERTIEVTSTRIPPSTKSRR